jgi:hypothetical protein
MLLVKEEDEKVAGGRGRCCWVKGEGSKSWARKEDVGGRWLGLVE